MSKVVSGLLLLFGFCLPFNSFAGITQEKAKDKMMMDLDIIKNTFEVRYAPAEWKKTYADWDLQAEIDLAKVKILEKPDITIKDYQRIVSDFFRSTQDYHVGVSFYSTEMALLPFSPYCPFIALIKSMQVTHLS